MLFLTPPPGGYAALCVISSMTLRLLSRSQVSIIQISCFSLYRVLTRVVCTEGLSHASVQIGPPQINASATTYHQLALLDRLSGQYSTININTRVLEYIAATQSSATTTTTTIAMCMIEPSDI